MSWIDCAEKTSLTWFAGFFFLDLECSVSVLEMWENKVQERYWSLLGDSYNHGCLVENFLDSWCFYWISTVQPDCLHVSQSHCCTAPPNPVLACSAAGFTQINSEYGWDQTNSQTSDRRLNLSFAKSGLVLGYLWLICHEFWVNEVFFSLTSQSHNKNNWWCPHCCICPTGQCGL